MPDRDPPNIREHMHVYTSDGQDIGHVAKVYKESFLVHKGFFFPTDRYIPVDAVTTVDNDRVNLSMDAETARLKEWEKRPNYEDHLGQPLQLFYDRGHGVHDPYDIENTNPDES